MIRLECLASLGRLSKKDWKRQKELEEMAEVAADVAARSRRDGRKPTWLTSEAVPTHPKLCCMPPAWKHSPRTKPRHPPPSARVSTGSVSETV